ncbi:Retinol dehydrogenase [Dorcoceras hygrometricum]|uniref:Retinol dehydrogenase n=1 Tax=Dorcoceras hygrometricum TaxID=472368 RepID=A0A2Z7CZQ0_9LAMI|nr:Retinol dehydrogenase [Dorcoceras hygrometricum]
MASFVINALQVNFESLLSMEYAGMVSMFRSLETSGLQGVLGVSISVFEEALNQFFTNATVITGKMLARWPSNKKKDMKVDYRLLHDVVAKSLSAKFPWFSSPGKQSPGYAVQLSILLEKLVKADLGESVALHPMKVLNKKSVLTYMEKNQAAPQAGSSVDPAKSRSETSSDDDKHPIATLAAARTGGAAAKRKVILAPSNSESTVSLSLLEIKKKQRTKRPKLVKPIPAKEEKAVSIDLPLEINWTTHFLPKIYPAAKSKEVLEAFARSNPVEEHCLLVIQSAWEVVFSKMSSFDEWAGFRNELVNQLGVPCTSGSKLLYQLGRPRTVPARYLRPVHLRRPLTVSIWISSRLLQSKQAAHVNPRDLGVHRPRAICQLVGRDVAALSFREIALKFNRHSSPYPYAMKLNLLRLPFFRNAKDPLEDFDYNDPRCNPLLRPVAARTPSHTTAHQPSCCVCLTHFFTASLNSRMLVNVGACEIDSLVNQLGVPCTSGSKLLYQLGRPRTVPARYLRPVQLRRPLIVSIWISSRLLQSKQAAHVKTRTQGYHEAAQVSAISSWSTNSGSRILSHRRVNTEAGSDLAQAGPQPVNISSSTLAILDLISEFKSMKKVVAYLESTVNMMWDDQSYLKYDAKQFRQVFYRKMDEVVATVNTILSALETNLVHQIHESHQLQLR